MILAAVLIVLLVLVGCGVFAVVEARRLAERRRRERPAVLEGAGSHLTVRR